MIYHLAESLIVTAAVAGSVAWLAAQSRFGRRLFAGNRSAHDESGCGGCGSAGACGNAKPHARHWERPSSSA